MRASFLPVGLAILLSSVAGPAGCGGSTETSQGGTGGVPAADAAMGGAAGSTPVPTCAERGGECVLMSSLTEPCPADSYDPFSGALAHCPTGAPRRCCVPKGKLGSPCTLTDTCDNGGCLPEQSGYPAGGYCPSICEPSVESCPAWAVCLPVLFSQAMGMCMLRCASSDMCREGWSCQAFPKSPFGGTGETTYVCWQGSMLGKELGAPCTKDDECISLLCRPDGQQQNRCSATCDDANPCLPGYGCKPATGCPTPGCGTCGPT